jgi:UDP-glucose 4-epimerase
LEYNGTEVFVITGGTGSFGNAVAQHLLQHDIAELRILSRDEAKQDAMRRKFSDHRLKFFIGDVRDAESLRGVMSGAQYVFHAAALKQVPSCEFYPLEAVKTNVLGTENVLRVALDSKIRKIVCLSTDKAVYPINAMGMSKALMEKVIVAKSRMNVSDTVICATRYGNVMASRGSVIPLFLEQLASAGPLTITDPSMTRFMMTLEDAVQLVLYAFENGENGDIFVQKAPAATIKVLVDALKQLRDQPNKEVRTIGTRHGEKLYETLCSKEEMAKALDLGEYYRIPCDDRDLNYNLYYSEGSELLPELEEYNSHNTQRLDKNQMAELLKKLSIIAT